MLTSQLSDSPYSRTSSSACYIAAILSPFIMFAYGEDGYVEWRYTYYKTNTEITEPPTDIPDRARYVYLTDNRIVTIATGAFSNLSLCTGLYLDYNEISEIRTVWCPS